MRGTLALVGGAGLGAGLMYLLDPERGERRRSALSESVACAVNDAADRFPAVSTARKRTSVSPWALIVTGFPATAALHVAPPSVDDSYS